MRATHLQTEYLTEPLGLGIASPRFYWHCEGGVRQTAYQLVATRGGEVVWDSGKVESSSMTHIQYAGTPLRRRQFWERKTMPPAMRSGGKVLFKIRQEFFSHSGRSCVDTQATHLLALRHGLSPDPVRMERDSDSEAERKRWEAANRVCGYAPALRGADESRPSKAGVQPAAQRGLSGLAL